MPVYSWFCLFVFVFYFVLFYFLTTIDLLSQSSYSQNICLIFHLQKINPTKHYLIIIMTNTDKVMWKSTLGWIPKSGVPTENMWKNVCRNFHLLQDLKLKYFEMVDFKHPSYSGYRHHELTNEINECRKYLRKSAVLHKKSLVSIDGKQLDKHW